MEYTPTFKHLEESKKPMGIPFLSVACYRKSSFDPYTSSTNPRDKNEQHSKTTFGKQELLSYLFILRTVSNNR